MITPGVHSVRADQAPVRQGPWLQAHPGLGRPCAGTTPVRLSLRLQHQLSGRSCRRATAQSARCVLPARRCQSPEMVVSGQISRAIASIRCAKSGLLWLIVLNACLRLLRLARACPPLFAVPCFFGRSCDWLRSASVSSVWLLRARANERRCSLRSFVLGSGQGCSFRSLARGSERGCRSGGNCACRSILAP